MVIQFTYVGEGIAQYKKGDILKYNTDTKPLPGDIIAAYIYGEMRLVRWQSRMRKKKDGFEFIGVVFI